jgi:hypothetical protein
VQRDGVCVRGGGALPMQYVVDKAPIDRVIDTMNPVDTLSYKFALTAAYNALLNQRLGCSARRSVDRPRAPYAAGPARRRPRYSARCMKGPSAYHGWWLPSSSVGSASTPP